QRLVTSDATPIRCAMGFCGSPGFAVACGQPHQQCLCQLVDDLRLDALLEQSPLEGVSELCTLEQVEFQRARLAIYPLQEFLQQFLQVCVRPAWILGSGARSAGALQDEVVRKSSANPGRVASIEPIEQHAEVDTESLCWAQNSTRFRPWIGGVLPGNW